MAHGRPRPNRIAKIFEAIAAHIPMEAWPVFLMTIIDVTRSGTAEPAAKMVIPEMVDGIEIISPIRKFQSYRLNE